MRRFSHFSWLLLLPLPVFGTPIQFTFQSQVVVDPNNFWGIGSPVTITLELDNGSDPSSNGDFFVSDLTSTPVSLELQDINSGTYTAQYNKISTNGGQIFHVDPDGLVDLVASDLSFIVDPVFSGSCDQYNGGDVSSPPNPLCSIVNDTVTTSAATTFGIDSISSSNLWSTDYTPPQDPPPPPPQLEPNPAPAPSPLVLIGLGLAGIGYTRRRKLTAS